MGVSVMILGESGRGKSRSIKGLNPEETIVVKVINKPFSFKSSEWKKWDKTANKGSYIVTDNYSHIEQLILKAKSMGKKTVVIDDAQYLMANEFMNRSDEVGFNKFTTIAKNMWSLITTANEKADDDLTIYFLQHTETSDKGDKAKTIGKMLDEKITIEGMVTVVLYAKKENDKYFFETQNNGSNTAKSPEEMFPDFRIENDLGVVDKSIREYYGI